MRVAGGLIGGTLGYNWQVSTATVNCCQMAQRYEAFSSFRMRANGASSTV